ncbi:MAG TPA: hypothetical protein DCQ32_09755 [Cyanobacteria bacterium UBA8156]|jgi:uncharacterized membrane protein YkoI|nr:hypothetical protein [Cyanobacteria bacterium UBA8156]
MSKIWLNGLAIALLLGGSGLAWADDRDGAVSLEQALGCLRAAVAARPGQVQDLDIKREDGRLVCKVEIVNRQDEYEVKLDAGTRQILRVKRD